MRRSVKAAGGLPSSTAAATTVPDGGRQGTSAGGGDGGSESTTLLAMDGGSDSNGRGGAQQLICGPPASEGGDQLPDSLGRAARGSRAARSRGSKPMALGLVFLVALASIILPTKTLACLAHQSPNLSYQSPHSLSVVNRYIDDEWQSFQHVVVDKNTGAVYAAGVNRLYQLDPDLNLLQTVVTGPITDSLKCSARGCRGEDIATMKLTDNINKVLLLDYLPARVIVCGTVSQGSCQVRDMRNITIITRNVSEPIVANNASTSTVAFIAPGPPNFPVSRVLYIGVTYTGRSVYRDDVPAVASRSLVDDRFFEIAAADISTSTRMMVNWQARTRYPITYVYGFSSGKFSYFLTRQRKNNQNDSPFISKLVRVCQNDLSYFSYTEVPLDCQDSNGKSYNLVQAASVGKAGIELSSQLGIQITDDVLFAVFSPSDPSQGEGSSVPMSESALCVYSVKNIQTKFTNNIQKCFKGEGHLGLDFILPSYKCIETRIHVDEDFCGMDVNTPLGGEQPIEEVALLTFPVRLTAVTIASTETYTVVYLGTADGHLKKVVVDDQNNALEYGDITVDEGSSIRQDMFFDKEGDHLYVVTSNKISKVKAQECSIYKGCDQCLGARDPYCGWCSLENKCSLRRNCSGATLEPQQWLSYKTGRCTTITTVT